jgi:hypothetical protein
LAGFGWIPSLIPLNAAAPGHQLNDQDNQRHHQQKVDQSARNVQAESQQPQNQNYYKNRPKHTFSFVQPAPSRRPGSEMQCGAISRNYAWAFAAPDVRRRRSFLIARTIPQSINAANAQSSGADHFCRVPDHNRITRGP